MAVLLAVERFYIFGHDLFGNGLRNVGVNGIRLQPGFLVVKELRKQLEEVLLMVDIHPGQLGAARLRRGPWDNLGCPLARDPGLLVHARLEKSVKLCEHSCPFPPVLSVAPKSDDELEYLLLDVEPRAETVLLNEVNQEVLLEGKTGRIDCSADFHRVLDPVLVDVEQLDLELLPFFDSVVQPEVVSFRDLGSGSPY